MSRAMTGGTPETLVLLHGFAGTRRAWDPVVEHLDPQRYRPLPLDLVGHGDAGCATTPITFDACVEAVLAQSPERFSLCGYSMGGRIALCAALAEPERVERLILISCTAGIQDSTERAERRAADRALADELERTPFDRFIERWRSQPLFANEPPRARRLAVEDHFRNDPRALAAAMRGLGTGEMPPLWKRLGELTMPTIVVVGERDAKFDKLGNRMVNLLAHGTLEKISGGHGLPVENPAGIARVLESA
jgi:2-succinyl-6-hydroxy-2,4-cyclohexadiene-1-carboxylate synthase